MNNDVNIVQVICAVVEKRVGKHNLMVVDKNFDDYVPDGETYIFPRNSILYQFRDGTLNIESGINDDVIEVKFARSLGKIKLIDPDNTFRINGENKAHCLGCDNGEPIPGVEYHNWSVEDLMKMKTIKLY